MIQIFFFTELYLFLASCYILADRYGTAFLFLIDLKNLIVTHRNLKRLILISNIVLIVLLCFSPMDPGPIVLGDLLPVINLLMLEFYFLGEFSNENEKSVVNKKRDIFGYATLATALLHLLFPKIVLI